MLANAASARVRAFAGVEEEEVEVDGGRGG